MSLSRIRVFEQRNYCSRHTLPSTLTQVWWRSVTRRKSMAGMGGAALALAAAGVVSEAGGGGRRGGSLLADVVHAVVGSGRSLGRSGRIRRLGTIQSLWRRLHLDGLAAPLGVHGFPVLSGVLAEEDSARRIDGQQPVQQRGGRDGGSVRWGASLALPDASQRSR